MKKTTLQKTLALVLTGAMALGVLSGCGGGSGDTGSSTSSGSNDTGASTSTSTDSNTSAETSTDSGSEDVASGLPGIAGYTAFADNVTLSIPVYDRGGDNIPIGENYWEQWLQENFGDQYNITLDFVPIPRTDVLTAYNLLASTDDLPTFLMEYDYPKQAEWVANGYAVPYDLDEFAFIAPTYYQRMIDLDQIKYTEFDGETYFVLAERPYYNTNYTFVTWYRMDWLREVGYDHIPATREEYVDAMTKIQEAGISAHPAGGSMTTGTAGVDQNYAFRTYPTPDVEWAMYGDYAIPSLGWEPNKKLLKEQNENYNLGFTDPDYFTIDKATADASFAAGQSYQYSEYIAADMPILTSFYQNNPDAELAVGIQSLDADTAYGTVPAFRSNNPFGMMISFSSDASEDEIKAAMMYMEWMTQEENLFVMQWGYEGDNFSYDDNGIPSSIGDYSGEYSQGFNNNKDYWCVTIEARNAGTIEDMISVSSPQGLPQDFTDDLIANYYNQVAAWEKGWVPVDAMFATDISSVAEYQGDLLTLYAELRDALVMCDPANFDALYEESAERYGAAGYTAIAEERKAAFEAGLVSAQ